MGSCPTLCLTWKFLKLTFMPQDIISSLFFSSNILQQWLGDPKIECTTAPTLFHTSCCRFIYGTFPLSLALFGDLLLLKNLRVFKLSALGYCALTKFIWYNSISNIFTSVTNVFLAGSKSPLLLKYLQIKRQFYMIFLLLSSRNIVKIEGKIQAIQPLLCFVDIRI